MRSSFFVIFLLISFIGFSQTKIYGKITNTENLPLQGANIIITKLQENIIITYAISDTGGEFSLSVNSKLDSLQISVSYIGYSKQTKIILNKNQELNFILLESSEELKEVFIKSFPITKRGDTINYSVSTFKDQKDKVLVDVLAKMPGIEVLPDGKILYQGNLINKYYIEGLDLLEGRYNLANNNLPVNSVSRVQVLENHQPIKLLDSLVYSDKAALNIKLKNNITVTGTGKLGTGFSPLLWDVNLTPMLFTKQQQIITSYQTNNIGIDISNEIKTLTIEDLLDRFESNNEKQDWVNILQLSPPPFSKKRWLDNNAHLFTTNYLIRLKKDLDLKVNLSYINDFQQQTGNTQTTFFTPIDTINIREYTKNKLFFSSLKSKFVLTKNIKKSYFKNTLDVNNYWDSQRGLIVLNNEEVSQNVKNPFTSFSNKLKWVQPLGKKLVTVKSIITHTRSPQKLRVTPSQFDSLLNNGDSFDTAYQRIVHSNFYTNNSFSFTKGFKNFTVTPKIGFSIQNQKLDSGISLFENDTETTLAMSFTNNLRFNSSSFYGIINTKYQLNNWKVELDTPFKFKSYNRIDNELNKFQKLNGLIFEPRLSIRKDLNAFWKASFSASIKNGFGDINQSYYGYILNNYRNIQQYETPILESSTNNLTFGISYRNPIKSLFISGFYSYNNSSQNLLFGNVINNNGTSALGFIKQDNNTSTHNINLRGSQFFSKAKTTLTLIANTSLVNKEQLLNDVLTNITSKNIQLKGELNTKITEWLNVGYKSDFSISNTQFENQSFRNIVTQKHLLNFNVYPTSIQYIGFDVEYHNNNFSTENQNNYFLNLNYRYTFKESGIDLDLNWNNILNTKEFISVFNDTYSYTQSSYLLRPSQILLSMKYSF